MRASLAYSTSPLVAKEVAMGNPPYEALSKLQEKRQRRTAPVCMWPQACARGSCLRNSPRGGTSSRVEKPWLVALVLSKGLHCMAISPSRSAIKGKKKGCKATPAKEGAAKGGSVALQQQCHRPLHEFI
ncbi:hypothetical protein L7F22_006768 [Adiantum nelumboides]|nr:hypothetical protein [Adiantum nelumboides]